MYQSASNQCLWDGCLGYFQYCVSLHIVLHEYYYTVSELPDSCSGGISTCNFVRYCQISFLPSMYDMQGSPDSPVPFLK